MKTVGKLLKEARESQKHSLINVERATKIKRSFIVAIEDGQWEKLPDLPVVAGFVNNLAGYLDVDRKQAAAFLRRDYPPKKIKVTPTPDLQKKRRLGPRVVFGLGVAAVILIVASYLGFQYLNFTNPPKLIIDSPTDGQSVFEYTLEVSGETDPSSTVVVNNQPVLVDDDGSFVTKIDVNKTTKEVIIKSLSRSGKETEVMRNIVVKIEE